MIFLSSLRASSLRVCFFGCMNDLNLQFVCTNFNIEVTDHFDNKIQWSPTTENTDFSFFGTPTPIEFLVGCFWFVPLFWRHMWELLSFNRILVQMAFVLSWVCLRTVYRNLHFRLHVLPDSLVLSVPTTVGHKVAFSANNCSLPAPCHYQHLEIQFSPHFAVQIRVKFFG